MLPRRIPNIRDGSSSLVFPFLTTMDTQPPHFSPSPLNFKLWTHQILNKTSKNALLFSLGKIYVWIGHSLSFRLVNFVLLYKRNVKGLIFEINSFSQDSKTFVNFLTWSLLIDTFLSCACTNLFS